MAKVKVAEKKAVAAPVKTHKEFKIGGRTFLVSTEDLVCSGLLAVLLILIHSIRSRFAGIPFERDEGIYSYFGTLVLEGKIPYKDFYETKFPGLYYFFGLMVGLFGDTVEGMHTGFMYLNMLTTVFVYFAARNLFSPVAGMISAITYAFVSLTPNLSGFTVQSEQGVAFFTSIGLLFYSLHRIYQKWYLLFLTGLAMGSAFMMKTSGVFFALWGGVVIITDFVFTKPRVVKQFWVNILSYAAGGFSIIIVLFAIILAKGSFNEMIYWAYEHPKQYVSGMPFEEGLKYFRYTRDAIVQNHKFFWVHSFLALALCLPKPIPIRYKIFGVTLLGFSFLTIVPGYFFYGHYWIQTVPGLSIVAGLTFYSVMAIMRDIFKIQKPGLKYLYLVVFVLFTLGHMNSKAMKPYYFHPNYERILRSVYGNNPFPESMEIAKYINANSKPEDNIVLIGSEPQIYFYTKKKSPSKHAYFTNIVNNIPAHHEMQREFVRDTEKANPKFLVFFNHPFSLLVQPNTDKYVFEWVNEYVTKNYRLVGVADMIEGQQTVYKWNEELNNYRPVSQNVIYIYERNTNTTNTPQK